MFSLINKKIILFSVILLTLILCNPKQSNAATLGVYPSTSKVKVGNFVSAKISVSTQGKSINNSEATVVYPKDILDVVSISKSSSIFTLWVEEPTFSNLDGTIIFNGGIPNPGYTGDGGEVITVNFKAKKVGSATITFKDSAVRENNGLGTDILTFTQPTSITIEQASTLVPIEKPIIVSSKELPPKPVVESETNPDQDMWYSSNTSSFSWTTPSNVSSIKTLFNKLPDSIPSISYDNSVSQKTINNISDGISYFHIRYINERGNGPIEHYKVQIDSNPPEKFNLVTGTKGVFSTVKLNAVDKLSGIDSYLIKIDDSNSAIRVRNVSSGNEEYTLPIQTGGDHNLQVIAYDKAGNKTESNTVFTSANIVSPIVKVNPESIVIGNYVNITGETIYNKAKVKIYIKGQDNYSKEYETVTSDKGTFNLKSEKNDTIGDFSISAQLVFSETVKSNISNIVKIDVTNTEAVKAAQDLTRNLIVFGIPSLILIVLLAIAYIGWYKFYGAKKKLDRELNVTISDVHESLVILKNELNNQLINLEQVRQDRDLNEAEERIFTQLQGNVDSIEKLIENRLMKLK